MALLIFCLGWPIYVKLPPSGSPLSRMSRTVYAAWLKRNQALPEDPNMLYELEGPESAIPNCAKLPYSKGMR